jgi:thiol-disulfide isomerase/thioredoxin
LLITHYSLLSFAKNGFMKDTALLIVLSLILFSGPSQSDPPSVDQILKEAMQQATKEKKNILIIFHASWCGWCRKMDSSINDESCRKFFEGSYVIRHMVAYESRDKKSLENPGVYEFLSRYNADELGLPSWFIFDQNGNLLADSQIRPPGANITTRGENIGCPTTGKEVASFIEVLKKTSHLNALQQAAIEKRFLKNAD